MKLTNEETLQILDLLRLLIEEEKREELQELYDFLEKKLYEFGE